MKNTHVKYIVLSLLLLLCVGVVSGCHPQYFLNISVTGDDLSDKNIDLLVKLRDKTDYIYKKECVFGGNPLMTLTVTEV
jgi:hypothetical protein